MYKLYSMQRSGNSYKVRLALALLDAPYKAIEVDILHGESRTPEFLAKNPSGQVPLLEVAEGRYLAESNAILWEVAGGRPLAPMPSRGALSGPAPVGRIIHEVGTTRMGGAARTSVLNANCQAHDVKNLFVADAGPFVSNSHKNCTWTIMALAMRTSEYIARQKNAGAI